MKRSIKSMNIKFANLFKMHFSNMSKHFSLLITLTDIPRMFSKSENLYKLVKTVIFGKNALLSQILLFNNN